MNLSELFTTKKAVYSFEVFPPKPTADFSAIRHTVEELASLDPDYISVTCSAGGTGNGGTIEIAKQIKDCGIEPLAHLTCIHSDRQSVRAALERLKSERILNVLALRGDKIAGAALSGDFAHASDLVAYIRKCDSDFNVAAACYPEGHPESENLKEDIRNLKKKVDAGVSHLNTQLFFDNEDFFRFSELAEVAGISVPVQAGVMPLVKKSHIDRIVALTGGKIPSKISRIIARFYDKPEALREAGIAYATEQIIDLLSAGAAGVHLYVMNNAYVARKITENIGYIRNELNRK